MTISLPAGLRPYKRTPTFTDASVPPALINDHSTKEGTWGLIHVEAGSLRYVVTDPRRPGSERILSPGDAPGIVEPTIRHHVEPLGPVRFHVEFLRAEA